MHVGEWNGDNNQMTFNEPMNHLDVQTVEALAKNVFFPPKLKLFLITHSSNKDIQNTNNLKTIHGNLFLLQ